jgi:transposase
MKRVELYAQVRRAVYVEGISQREAARRFGVDPRTIAKMVAFSVPPGYRRSGPPARPKLDPFVGIIDRILEEDKAQPAKQQHTAKRIFERLRDEHRYANRHSRPLKPAKGCAGVPRRRWDPASTLFIS